ncbi:MAG: 30S ribosomal protein S7 [bacterium]|jgi:small subunit ribosomal protein S7|nr:30S ribosomal protein S7 [bacterium]MDD3805396.1 30S ribosomal protein S7 [bacterium]MDD4558511.1 30S ribosomal protein S7 [bacterium]
MPRKGAVPKREITPDPVYNSQLVGRFINSLMQRGKKSIAEGIFYQSMEIIREKSGRDPIEVFEDAIKNAAPVIEVKSRRVGGATYQVPVEVRADRRVALAIRWMLGFARKRSGKSMQEKLSAEFMDAAQGVGSTIKKREDTHKMAEANKAFAHYRW